MKYFWCWIFPPLGILLCNRPGLAFVNFLLCCTIIGFPFAAIWSYMVAAEHYAEERNNKLIGAIRGRGRGRLSARHGSDEMAPANDNPFAF